MEDLSGDLGTMGGGGGYWSNPDNVVGLIGSSGDAVGSWLQAFGVTQQQPVQTPFIPPVQEDRGMPAWAWILIALAVLALIIIIILLRK